VPTSPALSKTAADYLAQAASRGRLVITSDRRGSTHRESTIALLLRRGLIAQDGGAAVDREVGRYGVARVYTTRVYRVA